MNKIVVITGGPNGIGLVTLPILHSRACMWLGAVAFTLAATFLSASAVRADGSGDPTAVREEDGKYFDKQGNPTYKIQPDGTVDWYSLSGYVRYNSECIRCHGPDGLGSSFAPALTDVLKTMSYTDFLGVVASRL